MSNKIILYSGLILGGFLLGHFRASTSIDKDVRAKVLKEKEVQALYSQIEFLKKDCKVLREEAREKAIQAVRDKCEVIKHKAEVQSALMDIANELNSYSHAELKVKLVVIASELNKY